MGTTFTISVPKIDKITKIHNTVEDIKQKTNCNFNIVPVIVSSEDCSVLLKHTAKDSHVILIDKNDIENLYNLLLNELRTEATQQLMDLTESY
jgi:hypothetical protein